MRPDATNRRRCCSRAGRSALSVVNWHATCCDRPCLASGLLTTERISPGSVRCTSRPAARRYLCTCRSGTARVRRRACHTLSAGQQRRGVGASYLATAAVILDGHFTALDNMAWLSLRHLARIAARRMVVLTTHHSLTQNTPATVSSTGQRAARATYSLFCWRATSAVPSPG